MAFSIWTTEATPEILSRAQELAEKFKSAPKMIFEKKAILKRQTIDLVQNFLYVLDGCDSFRMEEIKASIEAIQKEILVMVLAYEKIIENTSLAVCDQDYEIVVLMWNILSDIRVHIKRRVLALKQQRS